MTELINEYDITVFLETVVYLAVSFALFFLGKIAYGAFHPKIKIKHELVVKDNLAFSIAHVGYFIGLICVIGGVLIGPSKGLFIDVRDITVYGLLAIILLNVSTLVNDKFILPKFSVEKEIVEDQNSGTGAVEAGNAIASGLIIHGALLGESNNMVFGLYTAVVFWLIGQVLLLITAKIYNMMISYNIHEHIEKDNVAVGIGFSGTLIAIGNLIGFAIREEFESWSISLVSIGIIFVSGLILLPVVRFITDKVLLPGAKISDEIVNQEKANIGAALIEAFAYIGGSVLITWCL